MHHSTAIKAESHPVTKQKWQEPAILIERSLAANAQGPDVSGGPAFGPLSTSPTT